MQFSLRTLLIVMLLSGPGLAIAWWIAHEVIAQASAGNHKPLHAIVVIGVVATIFTFLLFRRVPRQE